MLNKEVFVKFIKLLSAGLIPTSAKDLQGLGLKELISLPIRGTEIYKIDTDLTSVIGPLEDGELQETKARLIQDCLINFLQLAEKIDNLAKLQINKDTKTHHYYITFKSCSLIKDGCIIDHHNVEYNYKIQNIETGDEFITLLNSLISEKIKSLYIDELFDTTISKYPILGTLRSENENLYTQMGIIDEEELNHLNEEWFNSVFSGLNLYIDFEFNIFDEEEENINELSMPDESIDSEETQENNPLVG